MINGHRIIHGDGMARYSPKIFDKTQPVYVRRIFKANGKDYYPGMVFDWKYHAVAHRRVQTLFNSGYLKHDEDITVDELAAEEAPKTDKMAMGDQEELTPDLEIKTPGYTIQHSGGPYYNVFGPDGDKINLKGLKKAAAVNLVESLTMGTTDETPIGDITI